MIYLGSDHAGFNLKEKIKKYLDEKKLKYKDFGTHSTDSVDASDYAVKVSAQIKRNTKSRGILVCGSGIMMSMAANRIKKVRAALCWNEEIVKQAREHNNANVLVLSGRESVPRNWKRMVDVFLTTKSLQATKYKKRINKLDKIK